MLYNDYTLERVFQSFAITPEPATLFPDAARVDAPGWLATVLGHRTQLALNSEKARSESIVAPILMASRELSPVPLAIFSGQRFDVDAERDLRGECDFILALTAPIPPVRAPIASVVEAKQSDIERGLGQCIAQMLAASLFNQKAGTNGPMFGIVTSGEVWQFLRLVNTTVQTDDQRYFLNDLPGILGALQTMIAEARAHIVPAA